MLPGLTCIALNHELPFHFIVAYIEQVSFGLWAATQNTHAPVLPQIHLVSSSPSAPSSFSPSSASASTDASLFPFRFALPGETEAELATDPSGGASSASSTLVAGFLLFRPLLLFDDIGGRTGASSPSESGVFDVECVVLRLPDRLISRGDIGGPIGAILYVQVVCFC